MSNDILHLFFKKSRKDFHLSDSASNVLTVPAVKSCPGITQFSAPENFGLRHLYAARLDRVTRNVRSKIMASVGTKDTCAEMGVRRMVHCMGYRCAPSSRSAWQTGPGISVTPKGDLRSRLFLAWAPMPLRSPSEIEAGVMASEDRDEQETRPVAEARTCATRLECSGSLAVPVKKTRLDLQTYREIFENQ